MVGEMEQLAPYTVQSLGSELRALGLTSGDTVLTHSSARSLGFVAGGTQAVVQALLDVLGPSGTLVVPTHTPDNTDPADWCNPPVPESWWPAIRAQAPGFDKSRTPSRWMGVIAETVRTWPGALRSDHPQVSFAALGRHAASVTGGHQMSNALGESSPLGAIYRLDGKVLLLGCGHDSNTSLHLAEWRQKSPARAVTGASVRRTDGTSEWISWTDIVANADDFEQIGAAFEVAVGLSTGQVGDATARLTPQRPLVDFATDWMETHRPKV
jgi:aminoglycoside 3-N-acetyltransferase